MTMGSNGKPKQVPILGSFTYALYGIKTAFKSERNLQIHFFSSIVVLLFSFYFSITKVEWMFILIAVTGMVTLELLNTAIERVVDLVTEEYHPLAKQAKDIAAGAVFVYAIFSVVIGIVIFLPYIWAIFV